FTLKTGLSFSPSHTRNVPVGPADKAASLAGDILTFGGNATLEMTETPIFNFVPLAGEQFAKAIDEPIPDKIFYTLYGQGWHADILTRTLVHSITYEPKNGTPKTLVNNPKNESYADFLTFCSGLFAA